MFLNYPHTDDFMTDTDELYEACITTFRRLGAGNEEEAQNFLSEAHSMVLHLSAGYAHLRRDTGPEMEQCQFLSQEWSDHRPIAADGASPESRVAHGLG